MKGTHDAYLAPLPDVPEWAIIVDGHRAITFGGPTAPSLALGHYAELIPELITRGEGDQERLSEDLHTQGQVLARTASELADMPVGLLGSHDPDHTTSDR